MKADTLARLSWTEANRMEFKHAFIVKAPVSVVAAFHRDTDVLRQLTPFPIIARIHQFDPLADGANARFTLWFGPLPVRWHAIHSDVSEIGFTDSQVSGPLKSWVHTHRFIAVGPNSTRVEDHIIYEHDSGWRGVISRLLFARPGLLYLFTARKFLTRRGVASLMTAEKAGTPAQ